MKFNEFMENIGLANVFHEFVVFQRISRGGIGKSCPAFFFNDCWLKMVGKLSSATLLNEFLVLKNLRL